MSLAACPTPADFLSEAEGTGPVRIDAESPFRTACRRFLAFQPPQIRRPLGKRMANSRIPSDALLRQSVPSMTATLEQAKAAAGTGLAVVNERRWSTLESRASICAAGFAGRPHCNRAKPDQARRPSLPEFTTGRSARINSPSRPLPCHRLALGRRQWRLRSPNAPRHRPLHSSPKALPQVLQRPGSGRLARLRRMGVPCNGPRRKLSASPRPVSFHFALFSRHCLVQGSHVSEIGSADQDRVGCGSHPAEVRRLLESASLSGGPHIDLLAAFMSEAVDPEPPFVRIAIREGMDSLSVRQTLAHFSFETITVWP